MPVYAFIRDSVIMVLAICDDGISAENAAAALGIDRVEDCTGHDPRPFIGWSWPVSGDPVYGPPPAAPPVRIISTLDLMQRFTESEFELLATHPADAAQAFVAKMQMCGNVWLDDPRLIAALDKMVTAGIIAADRPEEIRS